MDYMPSSFTMYNVIDDRFDLMSNTIVRVMYDPTDETFIEMWNV